jgi:hypothetical protein
MSEAPLQPYMRSTNMSSALLFHLPYELSEETSSMLPKIRIGANLEEVFSFIFLILRIPAGFGKNRGNIFLYHRQSSRLTRNRRSFFLYIQEGSARSPS